MKKFCNVLERMQLVLGVLTLITYIVCTAYQVIARWTPGITAEFTEEIANYSFIWSAFMGAAIMLRHNKHFCFTALSAKLKGKTRFVNEMIVMLILLAFSLLVMVHGYQLTLKFWNWKLSSVPTISLGLAWLCLPVAGFTSSVYMLESIVNFIKDPSSRKTEEEEEIERLDQEMAELERQQKENGGLNPQEGV